MPRPCKVRRICCEPPIRAFGPLGQEGKETVQLTFEEYEAIRLIDLLDLTQEECAARMGVARTTVQAVYNSARKKLAGGLVKGKTLVIQGGNYRLCPRAQECCAKNCGRGGCDNKRCSQRTGGMCNENCGNL